MNKSIYKNCYRNSLPAYILDLNYNVIEVNTLMKNFAKDNFTIEVGLNITEFLQEIDNMEECAARIAKEFSIGDLPYADIEDIHVTHKVYGKCHMKKFASQLQENGENKAWLVEYNMMRVENAEKFWSDVKAWITEDYN